MTKKTSGQQSSRLDKNWLGDKNRLGDKNQLGDKDRLKEFRQRLPQRDEARGNIDAIKARMVAAKSDLTIPIKTRLERALPTPVPASDLTAVTAEPTLPTEDIIQPETAPKSADVAPQAKPSGRTEEFETKDGFQIFKSRSVPQKPVLADLPEQVDRNEQSDVEPVPMAPDAIEDALKLIEEEDQSDFALPEKSAVGFTPSNLMVDEDETPDLPIGDFGGNFDAPEASNQNQIDDLKASDDEIELAAALSAELSALPQNHDVASLDNNEANVSVLDDDHRRNIEIGRNVASSIKSIIRDEVDETLDRIARQAVRDALKAHRAL